jgi:hypothetical protein
MIEPMKPEPAESVRPLSAAERLAARVAGQPMPSLHIGGSTWSAVAISASWRSRCSATAVTHGRPGALRSAEMQDTPGALLQAAKRKPFGAVISIRSHHHGSARTCHRRRRSRRKPAAGWRDACIPHAWHNEHVACILASSPTWAGRATATISVLRVMCEHLDARFPTRSVRVGQISRVFSAHTQGPYQYATNAGLRFDGRDVLASRASIPSYRWTYRGRMRGVGATCTAPKTHGRLTCISAPEYCKFWRGTKSASTPLRQSGVSRLAATDGAGIRRQIDGIRGGVRHCASTLKIRATTRVSTLKIRATTRVFRGPSDRQAPIFRQESEGGIRGEFGGSRAARADGTDVWAWDRRSEQLAHAGVLPGERDWEVPPSLLP